jgi:predicted dehydrogenase
LCFCLGEFKELSSVVATQRQRVKIVETGETIPMTSPDQVLLSGVLQSGAVASVHLRGGTANGTDFLFEIHGTEGDLAIVPADPRQATYIQVSEFTVRSAQAGKPLADLSIPESYRWVPPAVPAGLPFNVAQLYMRMAEGMRALSMQRLESRLVGSALRAWHRLGEVETRQRAMYHGAARVLDTRANLESQIGHPTRLHAPMACAIFEAYPYDEPVTTGDPGWRTS